MRRPLERRSMLFTRETLTAFRLRCAWIALMFVLIRTGIPPCVRDASMRNDVVCHPRYDTGKGAGRVVASFRACDTDARVRRALKDREIPLRPSSRSPRAL